MTNNAAELHALRFALNHLLAKSERECLPPVQIFVDNLFAINTTLGKWQAHIHTDLIGDVQCELLRLRKLTRVDIFWVPAHAGIFDNDVADFLAKRGAEGCTSTSALAEEEVAGLSRSPLHPITPPKQDSDREVADDVSDDDDNDEHGDVKSRGADEMAQPDPPLDVINVDLSPCPLLIQCPTQCETAPRFSSLPRHFLCTLT